MESPNSVVAESTEPPVGGRPGIPLNLAPSLFPYRRHENLSVRIEQLPFQARLSRGHNNGDRSWSLKPEELDGLIYTPPDGFVGNHVLTVRIVSIKNEDAKVLTAFDMTVGSDDLVGDNGATDGSNGLATVRRKADPNAKDWLSKAKAVWQAKSEKRVAAAEAKTKAEMERNLETAGAALDLALTRAGAAEAAEKEASARLDSLERRSQASEAAAEDARTRLESAEKRAQEAEAAADDAKGRLESVAKHVTEVEAMARDARARAEVETAEELARLKRELAAAEAARVEDVEYARKVALETAEAARATEISALREHHAAELKRKAAEAEAAVQAAKGELDNAGKRVAEVEAAAQDARVRAETESAEELSRLRRELAAAEAARAEDVDRARKAALETAEVTRVEDVEFARKVALETAEAARVTEIAALRDFHAAELEKQAAETRERLETEFSKRLAEARAAWEPEMNDRLETARQAAKAEALEQLAATREVQEAESATAFSTMTERSERALDDARTQINASLLVELDRLRDELASAREAAAKHDLRLSEAGDPANVGSAVPAIDIEKKLAEARATWERESGERLADARATWEREAGERLADTRATWERESEERLADARRKVENEAADRLATARAAWQSELQAALEEALDRADRAERVLVETAERAERRFEENTEQAKRAFQDERATMEAAHRAEVARLRDDLSRAEAAVTLRNSELAELHRHIERADAQTESPARETATALAEARTAWERELEDRLGEARRVADEEAQALLKQSRGRWEEETEALLKSEERIWNSREAERLEAVREECASAYRRKILNAATKSQKSKKARALHLAMKIGVIAACILAAVIVVPRAVTLVDTRWGPEIRQIVRHAERLFKQAGSIFYASPPERRVRSRKAPPAAAVHAIVGVESANVRADPSISAATIGSLPRGSRIILIERRGEWVRFPFQAAHDGIGWVHGSLLDADKSAQANRPDTAEPRSARPN